MGYILVHFPHCPWPYNYTTGTQRSWSLHASCSRAASVPFFVTRRSMLTDCLQLGSSRGDHKLSETIAANACSVPCWNTWPLEVHVPHVCTCLSRGTSCSRLGSTGHALNEPSVWEPSLAAAERNGGVENQQGHTTHWQVELDYTLKQSRGMHIESNSLATVTQYNYMHGVFYCSFRLITIANFNWG